MVCCRYININANIVTRNFKVLVPGKNMKGYTPERNPMHAKCVPTSVQKSATLKNTNENTKSCRRNKTDI